MEKRGAEKRRQAELPPFSTLDGIGDGPDGSIGIKLAVSGVTLEEGGESPTKTITLAPVQPVTIPQFPTELPPAALLLLKEHFAVGIDLSRKARTTYNVQVARSRV